MKVDYLIVGAGLAGCVIAERIATQLNKSVVIIDRRSHLAGNCFDYTDDAGIIVHKYGPHIFHTNSKKVWDYLSGFTEWHPYEHKVLGVIDGKTVPVPFNFNSIRKMFPKEYAELLEAKLLEKYELNLKIPILKLLENTDPDLQNLAKYIYDKIFFGYTYKQWGVTPEKLDYSVTSRVPVLIGFDNRYFQDTYQAIPAKGYTEMFRRLLESKNIKLQLNCSFNDAKDIIEFDKLIYTGAIDEYFDFVFGSLPYRSLNFDFKNVEQEYFQETAQVNYPNDFDYTRITEFKHFLNQKTSSTTIAYEFPTAYDIGINEPYYPIPAEANRELYAKYLAEAEKLSGRVYFIGRLANYIYYNMDQIVGAALQLFETKISKNL
ncbi:MAG: UDP-galactopyranose mutase [Ignavibacteria bacterium]|nr:UDP-galactopyranose mutase [Ignavibacteria bacterium]